VAEISSLVSTWWKESQLPLPPDKTPPEKPQPPQPGQATGPTSPSPRKNRGNALKRRTPLDNPDAGGNPPESDITPVNQAGVSAELKRIGEALIEIADNQESPTPQQIERIQTLIIELSTLFSRFAQPATPDGVGNERAG
jgi:hypothetical protein